MLLEMCLSRLSIWSNSSRSLRGVCWERPGGGLMEWAGLGSVAGLQGSFKGCFTGGDTALHGSADNTY